MRSVLLFASSLLLIASPAFTQGDPRRPPTDPPIVVQRSSDGSPGATPRSIGAVSRGDRAPDFELPGHTGDNVRLSRLRGGWVALWFSPRREALVQVDSLAHALKPDHVTVVAVSGERIGLLDAWATRHSTPALLLSDATGDVAAMYGAWDTSRNVPLPGLVLIDPKGTVRIAALKPGMGTGEAAPLVHYAVTGE